MQQHSVVSAYDSQVSTLELALSNVAELGSAASELTRRNDFEHPPRSQGLVARTWTAARRG